MNLIVLNIGIGHAIERVFHINDGDDDYIHMVAPGNSQDWRKRRCCPAGWIKPQHILMIILQTAWKSCKQSATR